MPLYGLNDRDRRRVNDAVGAFEQGQPAGGAQRRILPAAPCLLQIDGAAGGGGFYTATIINRPTAKLDVSVGLTGDALGTAGPAAYYANLAEVGATTHDLMDPNNTRQKFFFGFPWYQATDGKMVYASTGIWLEDCTTGGGG